MICKLTHFKDLGLVMFAWFFYSDALETSTQFVVQVWEAYNFPQSDRNLVLLLLFIGIPIGTLITQKIKENTAISFTHLLMIEVLLFGFVFGLGFFVWEGSVFWTSLCLGMV